MNFFKFCKDLHRHNLCYASSGNISQKIQKNEDTEELWITRSGGWIENLSGEDICRYCPSTGEIDGPDPSSEFKIHLYIYEKRPDVNVVCHCQPEYSTALACSKVQVDYNVIPEVPYYIGAVSRVPYVTPGTEELASAVADKCTEANLLLLENHGIVAYGQDFDQVFQRIIFFELAAKILYLNGGRCSSIRDLDCDLLRLKYKASTQSKDYAHS